MFSDSVECLFERVIYLIIFHILLILFLWSYYQTIFSPVGRPRKEVISVSELKVEWRNFFQIPDH